MTLWISLPQECTSHPRLG